MRVLIKSGLNLFRKKFFLSLIIILQISVTVLLTNLIVGSYNLFNEAFTLTKNFPAQQTYFLMSGYSESGLSAKTKKTQELLNKYKNEIIAEQVITHETLSDNKQPYFTISYGEKTSEYLNMPLKKGCWYTEGEVSDYVPCVVRGKYNVGDIIRLPVAYEQENTEKKQISEDDVVKNPNLKQKTKTEPVYINFKVTGVLKDNYRILTYATSSNNLTLERLFDKITDKPVLLFNQKYLNKFNIKIGFLPDKNAILYMQTDNQEIKRQIANDFKDQSWVVPFETSYTESKSELSKNIEILMPLMISVFLIGLVSALCLTLLNAYNHIRIFPIYYICGMNWKSSFLIISSYVMCLLICAALVFAGFVLIPVVDLCTGPYIINSLNVFSSIAIFIIMAGISLTAPYFLLKKEQPLKQLKQGW